MCTQSFMSNYGITFVVYTALTHGVHISPLSTPSKMTLGCDNQAFYLMLNSTDCFPKAVFTCVLN